MKNPTAFVLIVAVNSDNESAGFGVMRNETFQKWEENELHPQIPDAFGLLYGGAEECDTFHTFEYANVHINECGGFIVDVVPTLAY